MSVSVMTRVFWTKFEPIPYRPKRNVTAPSIKLVMLAIADSTDDQGEGSWNSTETLAVKTNLDERTIQRVLVACLDTQLLYDTGASEFGTHKLSIELEKLAAPPAKKHKKSGGQKGNHNARKHRNSNLIGGED